MKLLFLDLDKTLLGNDYSSKRAKPFVDELKKLDFKIIFNSSKTRKEQEYYQKKFGIMEPFIVENGSAVYFLKNSLTFSDLLDYDIKGYQVIKLVNIEYDTIRKVLDSLSSRYNLKYYGNSTEEEIIKFTGLTRKLAGLAIIREFSETIFTGVNEELIDELKMHGLNIVKGSRFYTVNGGSDKGRAVKRVIELFSLKGDVISAAIGDGENDIPMLEAVDLPFIVGNTIEVARSFRLCSIKEFFQFYNQNKTRFVK